MQDVVGLAGLDPDFVMLRNSMREQMFEYIARKLSAANWRQRWRLLDLTRRLEEILFRKFSNKNDYYNMMKGPIEPQLQFAIKTLSAQNQQNQQMSRQIASSSGYGTMIPTPGITQGTSGNSRMPHVTDNIGLSSSGAGMVPQNASMGTSLPVRLSVPFACTTAKIATDQPQTTSLSAGKQKTPVNTSFSAKIIPTSQHVRRNIFSDHTSTKQITDTENTESQPDKAALSPTRALTNLSYKRSASPPAQFTSDPPTKKTRSSTKKTNE